MKEWKREQQGKGLYDTSSSDPELSEEEGIVDQVIPDKNQKLEEEIRHLTEQIIIWENYIIHITEREIFWTKIHLILPY